MTGTLRALVAPNHPALRAKNALVETNDPALRPLLADLEATCRAHRGLGLAAPQLGTSLQVAVLYIGAGHFLCLVNPAVAQRSAEETVDFEGCLSLPGRIVPVRRADRVTVSYQSPDDPHVHFSALTGLIARAAQHELDHLAGTLITDYL